jgi:hypothetical protein
LALGDMTGKTSDEVIAAVGRPSAISSMAGGMTLLQWQAQIMHQYAQYARAPTPTGCMTTIAIPARFV